MIENIIPQIEPLDSQAMEKCQLRLDNLTKPLGSLHAFEHLACKMAGIVGSSRPKRTPSVIVLVNGSRRTRGLIDVFAAQVSATVVSLDVIEEVDEEVNSGAKTVNRILAQGIKIAGEAAADGAQVIGVGLVGELDPVAATRVLAKLNDASANDLSALTILKQQASMELVGLVGIILGAASSKAAVTLDGAATSLAALIACRISPGVRDYLINSHFSAEPVHAEAIKLMDLPTYLYLGLNAGEGVGAALGISLINASLHVLNDMKTFGEAEVSVAEDGPGALVQDRNVKD
jgi:nicotinate-nucleotide--dimethylbenzimidazole phosphoribosyltransferase